MNNIEIGGFVVGVFQTNVYVLHRKGRTDAVLVDPGAFGNELVDAVGKEGLQITAVLLTHAHFDHIGGVSEVVERTGAPVYIGEREQRLIRDTEANLSLDQRQPTTVRPDYFLRDGEEVTLAGMTFRCLHTPGHTEGSCCYYMEETGTEEPEGDGPEAGTPCPPILLAGDTLFQESVGRTDMPTGSMSQLVRSIHDRLFVLPEDTLVYPGHGGMTSIGYEKQNNPYA